MLYFATFFGCWWMRTTTTTDSTSTHWTDNLLQCLTLLNLKSFYFWHWFFKWDIMYETSLKDHWTVSEPFITLFYSKTITCDTFLHIFWYLHFENNQNTRSVT
jgi:hypothetical protein